MACTDFRAYLNGKRTGRENRIPSKRIYRMLYREYDEGEQTELF